jgi:DNA-binding NarL/FixJ family response regulator
MIRSVLIADDNPRIRQALCNLFENEADFDVCGEANNGREMIEKARQLEPELIVADLSMPLMNGLEAARVLNRTMPAVPVVIYTAHSDPFLEKELVSVGACVVSKYEGAGVLVNTARTLLDGITIR